MEHLKWIADVCGWLVAIAGFVTLLRKTAHPIKSINERISKLERYSRDNYMSFLKLTIMSEEIPLEERLKAGAKYVDEGGNGAIKAKYHMLTDEYIEKNGGR